MTVNQLALVLIFVGLVAFVVFQRRPTQRSRTQAGLPTDGQLAGTISRDDDRFWPGGFFYNNPDDPAVFVPKRFGLGWTLNVGNPLGRLILIGALALVVALVILKRS